MADLDGLAKSVAGVWEGLLACAPDSMDAAKTDRYVRDVQDAAISARPLVSDAGTMSTPTESNAVALTEAARRTQAVRVEVAVVAAAAAAAAAAEARAERAERAERTALKRMSAAEATAAQVGGRGSQTCSLHAVRSMFPRLKVRARGLGPEGSARHPLHRRSCNCMHTAAIFHRRRWRR